MVRKRKFFYCSICWLIFLCSSLCVAQQVVPTWNILPAESSISFTATQNGAPVSGKFTRFTGEIVADTQALEHSHVLLKVDTASISTSYKELTLTLASPDWFNSALFPYAVFSANQFKKVGDHLYLAEGNIKIRDKTQPLQVNFMLEQIAPNKAKASGYFFLKRNQFGVGQGEWMSTKEIKDEVKVEFSISAERLS